MMTFETSYLPILLVLFLKLIDEKEIKDKEFSIIPSNKYKIVFDLYRGD